MLVVREDIIKLIHPIEQAQEEGFLKQEIIDRSGSPWNPRGIEYQKVEFGTDDTA